MVDLLSLIEITGISHEQAVQVWQPFLLYVVGIVIYSIFIFEFYRLIARRDVFRLELQEYAHGFDRLENIARIMLYVLQYLLLFPVLTIIWFLAFTAFLAPIAKTQSIDALLLLTMSVVTAIRATAYYHTSLAQDLAKMLPFALLGVFIVEGGNVSINRAFETLLAIPGEWQTVLYYLLFLILLELVLRIITILYRGTVETEDVEEDKDVSGDGEE